MKNILKFKIDENLPVELIENLSDANHDAISVRDQRLKGTDDRILSRICKKEERILVTLDTDFSDVRTYPPDEYPGIIVIRVRRQSKRHVINTFNKAIPL